MVRKSSLLFTFVLFAGLHEQAKADILGTAQTFAVLAGSQVTNVGPTVVSGNLGVWPGSAITGFPPGIVTGGAIHAADPVAMQAQSDVTTAYNDLAGMPFTQNLTGQDLGGLTLTPGVYFFSSTAQLTGTLTLNAQGNPDSMFVFQIGSMLTTASNSTVATINDADDCHVYWQIGSSATLGTGTSFQGNILALTSITLNTGANILDGRALARNGAVTLDDIDVVAGCVCIPGTLPHFTTCEDMPMASVGVALTFQVCAAGGGQGDPVTLTLDNGLPAGATLTPPLPATGATVCTTFLWTPTVDQIGAPVLEFTATNAHGCGTGCKMRISVERTLMLFGPHYGSSQFPMFEHLFDTQLTQVRRAFPVTMESIPSFLYDALPWQYSVQVVTYSPLLFPQQPSRWSYAMEFTKDLNLPVPGMHSEPHGDMNGIDMAVHTYTDTAGHLRVKFPFHVLGL